MADIKFNQTEIANSEHIDKLSTGDNVSAKKVANYVFDEDSLTWVRDTGSSAGLVPIGYDALTYTATSSTIDTYKYYTGGTSGTLVATVTVTYTDATHATLVSVVRT